MFLDEQSTFFVVPSLEKKGESEGLPSSKAEALQRGYKMEKDGVRAVVGEKRWENAAEGSGAYEIAGWKKAEDFEPTYVSHRDCPLYDETFGECSGAREAQMEDMRAMQYQARVLAGAFVVRVGAGEKGEKDEGNGKGVGEGERCGAWKEDIGRSKVRAAVLAARVSKTPGLLRNTHYPPWIRNITLYDPKNPKAFEEAIAKKSAAEQTADWTKCADYADAMCAAAEAELAELQQTARTLILYLGAVITGIAITLVSILLMKRRTARKR